MSDLQHIRVMQSSVMRKIRRSNLIRRRVNIRRNNIKKDKHRKKNRHNQYYQPNRYENIDVVFNGDFRLLYDTENVIRSINKAIDYTKRGGRFSINFDMSKIRHLDIGAIGLLLSTVNTLTKNNCPVSGNIPEDRECQQLFFDSGFLDHVNLIQGKKPKRNEKNLLIERGFDKTSNMNIAKEVRKAVRHLTELEEPYRPVYNIIQEMCANSIEHANQERHRKNWLMATYYTEDKVIFTMTDIGQGILGTLRKKLSQKVRDTISDNVSVLEGVFDKKYQSSTFDNNRNKGLPKIKETNANNYIENLKVITNDVFLDFNEKSISRHLSSKLRGTFYYWELTKNAISKWKQRKN